MSMLKRYQKPGGFVQLLNLMETSGPAKREKFFKLIREENTVWAEELEKKMLNIEKIMAWEGSILGEIAMTLPEQVIAVALHGIQPEHRDKFMETLTHGQKRNINDLFEGKEPTNLEISSVFIRIINETRNLIKLGKIRLFKIAPELHIPEDFEDSLAGNNTLFAQGDTGSNSDFNIEPIKNNQPNGGGVNPAVVEKYENRIKSLQFENAQLKNDIIKLNAKLADIRRMAA